MPSEIFQPSERVIVALSGGKASAWCADWALRNYPKEQVILYFNDTKWEHPDLYRFLSDLSAYWNHPITEDSDGRSVEQLAFDKPVFPCNRVPVCSVILKAERLKRFYNDGDTLIFGIGIKERHRATRIIGSYQQFESKKGKYPIIEFPLIQECVTGEQVDEWLMSTGIKQPVMYDLGFDHNNCSGGCVRMNPKRWLHLLRTFPDVYAEREGFEQRYSERFGRQFSFMYGLPLLKLRIMAENQQTIVFEPEDDMPLECVGGCADE